MTRSVTSFTSGSRVAAGSLQGLMSTANAARERPCTTTSSSSGRDTLLTPCHVNMCEDYTVTLSLTFSLYIREDYTINMQAWAARDRLAWVMVTVATTRLSAADWLDSLHMPAAVVPSAASLQVCRDQAPQRTTLLLVLQTPRQLEPSPTGCSESPLLLLLQK